MHLLRGNVEDLDGRVVVFTKTVLGDGIFANFLSQSLDSLLARFPKQTKHLSDVKKAAQSLIQKGQSPVYVIPVNICRELELYVGSNDVLYAGDCVDEKNAARLLRTGGALYMDAFLYHDVPDFHSVTPNDFNAEELKEHIVKMYLAPMRYAVRCNSTDDFAGLRRDFERFSAGSRFEQDVARLCDAVLQGNVPLSAAYLERIFAVEREDFRYAQLLSDKIKELVSPS